jgi:hypothetical protein
LSHNSKRGSRRRILYTDLSDSEWTWINATLTSAAVWRSRPGRPYKRHREVWNGILWIMRTGRPWADLPKKYPSPKTCNRWMRDLSDTGMFSKAAFYFLASFGLVSDIGWRLSEEEVSRRLGPRDKPKGRRQGVLWGFIGGWQWCLARHELIAPQFAEGDYGEEYFEAILKTAGTNRKRISRTRRMWRW